MFQESGELIREICAAAMRQDRPDIAENILKVADIEETAYNLLA